MLRIIVRRWYAALPVLAVVLALGPRLVASADPEYEATGSVVLLQYDPTTATTPPDDEDTPQNPYTDFSGSVGITAAVLENIGNGDALRTGVAAAGGSTDFAIEQDEETPILVIEATAASRPEAIATVASVAAALEAELADRQDRFSVPAEDRIVLEEVLLPTQATQLETARNRALTIVIASGVAGVIGASVLAESFARGRARHRRAAKSETLMRLAALSGDGTDTPPGGTSSAGENNGDASMPSEQHGR